MSINRGLVLSAVDHHNPTGAIELLKDVTPYELGEPPPLAGTLYPVYIRGEAYLLLKRGDKAAVEFPGEGTYYDIYYSH